MTPSPHRPVRRGTHGPKGPIALLVVVGLVACGSTADETGQDAPPEGPSAPSDLMDTCGAGWVEECERAGCDPADASWAGCRINGWSGYAAPPTCAVDTGFPGDDRVPCPPDPAEGFQLHFGPSDYADPSAMEKHVVPPDNGDVDIQCVYLPLPNTEERFLGHMVGRVRHRFVRNFDDEQRAARMLLGVFADSFTGQSETRSPAAPRGYLTPP